MEIIILDIFSQPHILNFASLLFSATIEYFRPSSHPSSLVTFLFGVCVCVLIPLSVFIPLSVTILYEVNNIKLSSNWLKHN